MKRRLISTTLSMICLLLVTASVQAQRATYRGTFQSVRRVIVRVENRSNVLQNSLQNWTNRNTTGSSNEDIHLFVRDFDQSVRHLRDRFNARQSTASDVQDVLNHASRIDAFMRRNSISAQMQNQWSSMRLDLNQLASAYNVRWPRVSSTYPTSQPNQVSSRLTGTYRLDFARSDDARRAAEGAARNLAPSERRRVLDRIAQRLEAPEQLALDVRSRNVTIASTRAAQISFVADGRDRTETNANNRTIRSRATLTGDQLLVSTTGDTGNDFSVTFASVDNGQRLNVTRRVFIQGLTNPVVVQSVYDKTANVAQFNIVQSAKRPTSNGRSSFPTTRALLRCLMTACRRGRLSEGDRFTLRVTDPGNSTSHD